MISQTNINTTLSYLLGENSVPSSSLAQSRNDFIQRTLDEVYRAYPWPFAQATATLTFDNGTATLPVNFDVQHKIYAYSYNGDTQTALEEVNIGDSDLLEASDHRFWAEHISDGRYKISTKDIDYGTAIVKYQTLPPTLSASTLSPFQDQMTVALGARRYVKLGQNPDADISQDEALFQKRLNENIAAVQINRPLRKHRSAYRSNGYVLGEV